MDLAARAYHRSLRIDPIVRSLLDTDFYKLLMLQLIWKWRRDTPVTFSVINRTTSVRLADEIDEAELREQLDHVRGLRFAENELIWLAGNRFYGVRHIFEPAFIEWLRSFALPEYQLERVDGQYVLTFSGPWQLTSLWEIPALAIISELRARNAMRRMGLFDIDLLYARAKCKMWSKIVRLQKLATEGPLHIGDFGTRRRHSYLWQKWCCACMREGIGASFIGTSNVHLAMTLGMEAIGTNGHELPMVYAALAGENDAALAHARYAVLEDWARLYSGNLLVLLPDAYGSTAFFQDAPDWVAKWTGLRPDSKEPIEAGEEAIAWWRAHGEDPREKLIIFSDAMDIDSIEKTHRHFAGRVRISYGWGTNLTNDFRGCATQPAPGLEPISLVCKVTEAGGRPAVKLSDNPEKASGPAKELARYRRVFRPDRE